MKQFIKNRKGQKISVVVDVAEESKGLVFVMHGLGGTKDQPHVQTFAEAFKEEGFITVLFDTTNSFGESEGNYEDATTTNYYEDLEDVIQWASNQDFYQEPFWLAGHSLGAISIILFTEKYPEKVKALAPISTVVSGKMSLDTSRYNGNDILKEWKEKGFRTEKSFSGKIKTLKWSHIEDRLKYDLMPEINKLTMPVLLIVGDKDESTPSEHQKIILDVLPGEKEMHIIEGAAHTFREEKHLDQIKTIFKSWIEKYN